MGAEGDTDRGRFFGFETQHIFALAIASKDSDAARAAKASVGWVVPRARTRVHPPLASYSPNIPSGTSPDHSGSTIPRLISRALRSGRACRMRWTQKIHEQIKTGTFPIRLKPEDWTSGPVNWLLDVIAPDAKATGQVIANFRQVVKEGDLRVHPLVAGLVDAEMRGKMMDAGKGPHV
jgi:hypothetical protein